MTEAQRAVCRRDPGDLEPHRGEKGLALPLHGAELAYRQEKLQRGRAPHALLGFGIWEASEDYTIAATRVSKVETRLTSCQHLLVAV